MVCPIRISLSVTPRCSALSADTLKARKAAVTNRDRMVVWYTTFPLCAFGGRSVHNSPSTSRNLFFSGVAIGTKREYRRACDKHERAKRPKGGFVGMQPLESQAHHEGADGRPDDEAGEQVSVQLPEALHSEISGRQKSNHVNFGAGCQTETDDADNWRDGAIEQIDSEARQKKEDGRNQWREYLVNQVSGQQAPGHRREADGNHQRRRRLGR